MKKESLEAGKFVTTHGIRGEVKIMPYTDTPELLAEFDRLFIGKNKDELIIERSRVFKNMVIAKIEGVDTPEAAEKLRNKVEEHANLARMSRRLAEIQLNVPIEFQIESLKFLIKFILE